MCLIITIYILFINAYYVSSFTSLYIDLITIDVILLNLNRCLLFFRGIKSLGGICPGGKRRGGANVGGGGSNVRGGKCRVTVLVYPGEKQFEDYGKYRIELITH